jgi:hypothetical protein
MTIPTVWYNMDSGNASRHERGRRSNNRDIAAFAMKFREDEHAAG